MRSLYLQVSVSCSPAGSSAGGSSIVTVCVAPGPLRLGCSFATLSAAHREMHSRSQPQEQVTSQRGRVVTLAYGLIDEIRGAR
jgi:hypothetical protein